MLKKMLFKTCFISLILILFTSTAMAEQPLDQETITRGAVLKQYEVVSGTRTARVWMTEIDLTDPYLKVDTIYGTGGQLGKNQTMDKMAAENEAIAAINGDFFDMAGGTPLGPLMKDGEWVTNPTAIAGLNALAWGKDQAIEIIPLSYSGYLTSENGQSYPVASLNKTTSLVNKINVFDEHWNVDNWPDKTLTSYTTVLVEDDHIAEISDNSRPGKISSDAFVVLGNGSGAQWLKDNLAVGDEVEYQLTISPAENWDTVMGAHTLLVDHGVRPASFARNITGYHARTAAGISQDQKTLYWVIVEKSSLSSGMTLEELADFMIRNGVYQGVNLDGGGSTTLVSRLPGEWDVTLKNIPQNGALRPVPVGLGLYTYAPEGKLKELLVGAPDFLLINERAELSIKAVDEYDNPIKTDTNTLTWNLKNSFLNLQGNDVVGAAPGQGLLELVSGKIKNAITLQVVGRDQIQSLSFGQEILQLDKGVTAAITPFVKTKEGKMRSVSAELFQWEWLGINGKIVDGEAAVADTQPDTGWLIGSYDGFCSMIPVQNGTFSQTIEDFEGDTVLKYTGLPKENLGEFVQESQNVKEGKYSGRLTYFFNFLYPDMQAAYGQFGDKGIAFDGTAKGISIWVKGDKSNYWLRAEVADDKGQIQYITLADKVNWSDWKQLQVNFSEPITSPVLKRIYLVNMPSDEERPAQGSIVIDQVQYLTWMPFPEENNVKVKLEVNKKSMQVDEAEITIDQGPIVENSRSYIPARFLIEAFGGNVYWSSQEKKVRIILGKNMMELFIDDSSHTNLNGVNIPSETAPIIRNSRTLIPVRMVTENLGYRVDWAQGKIDIYKNN